MEIFWQVEHRRLDLVMHRMALGVGRMAQGHEREIEACSLQPEDFLRDEGLREARIAFQDDGDSTTFRQSALIP